MEKIVKVVGEDVVGDGYSWWYNGQTGQHLDTLESCEAEAGYEKAMITVGAEVETLQLEAAGTASYTEVGDWWWDAPTENLDKLRIAISQSPIIVIV